MGRRRLSTQPGVFEAARLFGAMRQELCSYTCTEIFSQGPPGLVDVVRTMLSSCFGIGLQYLCYFFSRFGWPIWGIHGSRCLVAHAVGLDVFSQVQQSGTHKVEQEPSAGKNRNHVI